MYLWGPTPILSYHNRNHGRNCGGGVHISSKIECVQVKSSRVGIFQLGKSGEEVAGMLS